MLLTSKEFFELYLKKVAELGLPKPDRSIIYKQYRNYTSLIELTDSDDGVLDFNVATDGINLRISFEPKYALFFYQ